MYFFVIVDARLKPSTASNYRHNLAAVILPAFGDRDFRDGAERFAAAGVHNTAVIGAAAWGADDVRQILHHRSGRDRPRQHRGSERETIRLRCPTTADASVTTVTALDIPLTICR